MVAQRMNFKILPGIGFFECRTNIGNQVWICDVRQSKFTPWPAKFNIFRFEYTLMKQPLLQEFQLQSAEKHQIVTMEKWQCLKKRAVSPKSECVDVQIIKL